MTDFWNKSSFSTTVVKRVGGFEVVRVPARRIRVGLLTPTYREEGEYLAIRRRGADPTDESALIGGSGFRHSSRRWTTRACRIITSRCTQMTDLLPPILVIIALAAGAVMLGDHHEDAQRALYCEMTAIWDADAARGLPPGERSGWPPYRGREVCR